MSSDHTSRLHHEQPGEPRHPSPGVEGADVTLPSDGNGPVEVLRITCSCTYCRARLPKIRDSVLGLWLLIGTIFYDQSRAT